MQKKLKRNVRWAVQETTHTHRRRGSDQNPHFKNQKSNQKSNKNSFAPPHHQSSFHPSILPSSHPSFLPASAERNRSASALGRAVLRACCCAACAQGRCPRHCSAICRRAWWSSTSSRPRCAKPSPRRAWTARGKPPPNRATRRRWTRCARSKARRRPKSASPLSGFRGANPKKGL